MNYLEQMIGDVYVKATSYLDALIYSNAGLCAAGLNSFPSGNFSSLFKSSKNLAFLFRI